MMREIIIRPVSYVVILAIGLAMTFTSCEKAPEVMALPPKESLQIDLDVFPKANDGTKSLELPGPNFNHSAGNVIIWNLGIAANIFVPIVAYAEAFNHEAVYLGDNSWEWSYSVNIGLNTYVASLIGERINNQEFSMTMYLTKSGMNGYENFEWFSGVIRYDHTAASWTMNRNPASKVAFLDIVYHKDFEAETADIRYKCVDPDNNLYNAFIEYGIDPEYDYDAYYTISNTAGTTYIEWNTETAAGRVSDLVQYGDDGWRCWDTLLQDVVCPE